MASWTVHYHIPPMKEVHKKHVLSMSAYKAQLHMEITVPNCKVTKVEGGNTYDSE